jgi:hypothetical protein
MKGEAPGTATANGCDSMMWGNSSRIFLLFKRKQNSFIFKKKTKTM